MFTQEGSETVIWWRNYHAISQMERVRICLFSYIIIDTRDFCGPCRIVRPQKEFIRPRTSSKFIAFLRSEFNTHMAKVINFINPMIRVYDSLSFKGL